MVSSEGSRSRELQKILHTFPLIEKLVVFTIDESSITAASTVPIVYFTTTTTTMFDHVTTKRFLLLLQGFEPHFVEHVRSRDHDCNV